jgi:AcrR family transcriptional regulator
MEAAAAAAHVSVRTLYRMFGTRQALLAAIDVEPSPTSRERVLATALELVGRQGMAELSMDELAEAAHVSRASLYRLFPGKPALFRGLIQTYSPWESVAEAIAASPDPSPEQVMPRVGHAMALALEGRTGLLLRIVQEMVKGDPDTTEGVRHAMAHGLPDLAKYLSDQMAAGNLRKLHPVVALQLLAGPIVVHELTRPLAGLVGFKIGREQFVDEVVARWLRTMAPD